MFTPPPPLVLHGPPRAVPRTTGQVLADNISGPVPVTADSLFGKAPTEHSKGWGGSRTGTAETRGIEGKAPAGGRGAAVEGGEPLRTTPWRRRSGGKGYRRQLTVFPYEHPLPVATTFDVTFHLPDVGLVANANHGPPVTTAEEAEDGGAGGGGVRGGEEMSGTVEVGEVRSTHLTWRMLRYCALAFPSCGCLVAFVG